jgi:hypothetical protein
MPSPLRSAVRSLVDIPRLDVATINFAYDPPLVRGVSSLLPEAFGSDLGRRHRDWTSC